MDSTYYHWAWTCPNCNRVFALPYQPELWSQHHPRPFPPEIPGTNFECCGQVHEINRDNIRWIPLDASKRLTDG